jgi:hypothetical protein
VVWDTEHLALETSDVVVVRKTSKGREEKGRLERARCLFGERRTFDLGWTWLEGDSIPAATRG